jgi:transcriptional regulator with XRE-family HTH domain
MVRGQRARRTVREHGPEPIDVHVGSRLRQARILAGMSQDELGSGIGVSFQAVQKYECGENRVSASRLFRAATFLKCTVSFFFEGIAPSGVEEQGGLDDGEAELVSHFRLIPDKDLRDTLLRMIKQLAAHDLGPGRP